MSGRRFHGTTKARNKRDAEAFERLLKEKAKQEVEQFRKTGNVPLTIDIAVGRYWTEKAQHRVDRKYFFAVLERLVQYFGKDKRLDEIDDDAIITLVAFQRKQLRWGKSKLKHAEVKTLSNATINRQTLVPLKAIFRRARVLWGYHLPHEPQWKEHLLKEPRERVREFQPEEQQALDRSIREDYQPWYQFLHLSGRRFKETLLRWSDVNWESGEIRTMGKGDVEVWTPITPSIREILESCRGHHPEFVFTFVARATSQGKVGGQRYPITYHGAISQWQGDRARSGVKNARLHDHRHNRATKLLRECRNLKIVQRVLNHANITTTAKYAHVMDDEVAEALERNAKSRNLSRTSFGGETQATDLR
ncbi:tyrosine-type recombinase/integrase [Sinorhizobium mexicanum]|uniref:tyrosine-type recombinase/integrase n=1 Tax=Sinorhizobium mexicanum TaxID=375549 RepID=UPI003CC9142C